MVRHSFLKGRLDVLTAVGCEGNGVINNPVRSDKPPNLVSEHEMLVLETGLRSKPVALG